MLVGSNQGERRIVPARGPARSPAAAGSDLPRHDPAARRRTNYGRRLTSRPIGTSRPLVAGRGRSARLPAVPAPGGRRAALRGLHPVALADPTGALEGDPVARRRGPVRSGRGRPLRARGRAAPLLEWLRSVHAHAAAGRARALAQRLPPGRAKPAPPCPAPRLWPGPPG